MHTEQKRNLYGFYCKRYKLSLVIHALHVFFSSSVFFPLSNRLHCSVYFNKSLTLQKMYDMMRFDVWAFLLCAHLLISLKPTPKFMRSSSFTKTFEKLMILNMAMMINAMLRGTMFMFKIHIVIQ